MKTLLLIQFLVTTLVISAEVQNKITALYDGAPLNRFDSEQEVCNEQYIVAGVPRDDDHGSVSGGVFMFDSCIQNFIT